MSSCGENKRERQRPKLMLGVNADVVFVKAESV